MSVQPPPSGLTYPPAAQPWPGAVVPAPAVEPVLPVELRQYHEFWRAPRYRWWKGVLALLVAAVIAVLAMVAAMVPQVISWVRDGTLPTSTDGVRMTPLLFLLNNLSIAAFIPAVMLAAWWVVGQRPKWLSSVVGGIRWGWLGRVALVIVPVWLVYNALDYLIPLASGQNPFEGMHWRDHTWFTLASVLLTTVFQCAGEEYLCRGFVPRAIASWIPSRKVGLLVGWLVSSLLFMSLHMSTDPYLNLFYFAFATTATWLTWRTGGLEAAIVLHSVNNLLAEATMPWIDYSDMFNRGAGTGSAWGLVVIPFFLLVCWLVERQVARLRPANMAAPGRAQLGSALVTSPAPVGAGYPG